MSSVTSFSSNMIVMMGSERYLLTLLSRGYPLLPEEKHHADHLRSPTLQNLFSRISAICKLEQRLGYRGGSSLLDF